VAETFTSPEADLGQKPPSAARFVGGLVAVSAALYLWSRSVPGSILIPWLIGALGLALVIGMCGIVLMSVLWHGLRHHDWRRPRWFVAVALAVAVVVGLAAFDVPLRIRFLASRDALEAVVEAAQSGDPTPDDGSLRAGWFDVSAVRVLPEGVLLYEANGNGFDDGGFAYLPGDDLPEGDTSFESPSFRSLGGHWYAFTSSW